MNIKVAPFTVSEKSINTKCLSKLSSLNSRAFFFFGGGGQIEDKTKFLSHPIVTRASQR